MKKLLACFSLLLLLAACGSSSDSFRMEGRFRNFNQGDFYIYNPERGTKDTIHVRDGRFDYRLELDAPVLLMMLFPNFSEMPVFAEPGVKLSVKGDASHLRETSIKGSDANDEMTDFRMETTQQTPVEQQQLAKDYVSDHPSSPIVLYLVKRYFVACAEPDYQKAWQLCQSIVKAQPDNLEAQHLMEQLKGLRNCTAKGKLPKFTATDTKGKKVDNSLLKADVNVVLAWASWQYDSQNMLRILSNKQKEHKNKLSVVTICLDADKNQGKRTLERDSIVWPNVCDGEMWQSPVLTQLGLATVGANIVTDRQGNIVARNLNTQQLREKLESLLKK